MRGIAAGIGMRKDRGIVRVFKRLGSSSGASMAQAKHHPHTFHLINDRTTESGEAGVDIEAASSSRVVSIVSDQHPTHAKLIECLHKTDVMLHWTHAFDV